MGLSTNCSQLQISREQPTRSAATLAASRGAAVIVRGPRLRACLAHVFENRFELGQLRRGPIEARESIGLRPVGRHRATIACARRSGERIALRSGRPSRSTKKKTLP